MVQGGGLDFIALVVMVDCNAVANQNGQDVSTFVQLELFSTNQTTTYTAGTVESLKI